MPVESDKAAVIFLIVVGHAPYNGETEHTMVLPAETSAENNIVTTVPIELPNNQVMPEALLAA